MSDEDVKAVEVALEKNQGELLSTLEALEGLAGHRTHAEGALPKVMNALMTRNYYTGCSIYTLSTDFHNGAAALDLSRQMIEDMINLEWMIVNDPEKQAGKFDIFVSIDRANGMKDAGLINIDLKKILTNEAIGEIINDDKEARKKLPIPEDKDQRSYNMKNFENMVSDIKAKINQTGFTEDILNRILWYYIQGNRKNHTSPSELLSYLQPDDAVVLSLKGDMQYALEVAYKVLFTIAMRYTDLLLKLNPEDELAKETQAKLIELHKLEAD